MINILNADLLIISQRLSYLRYQNPRTMSLTFIDTDLFDLFSVQAISKGPYILELIKFRLNEMDDLNQISLFTVNLERGHYK